MGAASHGHCIIGFEVKEEDLVDLEDLGLRCHSCGSTTGKFCSNCGKATRVAFKRTWNDRAVDLADHLKIRLIGPFDTSWFENFDNHMARPEGQNCSLGVRLPPGAYGQKVIMEAFEEARVLAKIVFPDKDVAVTLWWHHELSW